MIYFLRIAIRLIFDVIQYIIRNGRDQSLLVNQIHFTKLQEYNIFTIPYLLLNKYGRFKVKRYLTVKAINLINGIDADIGYTKEASPLIGQNILQLNTLFMFMENNCIDLTRFGSFTEQNMIKLFVSDNMEIEKYSFNDIIYDTYGKEDENSSKIRYYLFHIVNLGTHAPGHFISCLLENNTKTLIADTKNPIYNFVVNLFSSEPSAINDRIGYNYANEDYWSIISILRPSFSSQYLNLQMKRELLVPHMRNQKTLASVCDAVLNKLNKTGNINYNSFDVKKINIVKDISNNFIEYINDYVDICYPDYDITDSKSKEWITQTINILNNVYPIDNTNFKQALKMIFGFLIDCIMIHSLAHPDLTARLIKRTLSIGSLHNFILSAFVTTADTQEFFYIDDYDLSLWNHQATKNITEKLINELKKVDPKLRITYVHY